MNLNRRIILLVALLLITSVVVWSLWQTSVALSLLKKGQLGSAAQTASPVVPVATVFSTITFHQVPDLEIWRVSLELITQTTSLTSTLNSEATPPSLRQITQQVSHLAALLEKSMIAKHLLTRVTPFHSTQLNDLATVLTHFTAQDRQYIILFQNNDELRATGGFAGSFGMARISNGRLADFTIQDIYEPDGQFQGFIEAPTGVKEYLSSGKGLRLPDANWSPDFPTSAQMMLTFFGLGKKDSISGVVAVNLAVVEKILAEVGDVYLPDYQMTVTPQNLAQLARADRDQFFPGSVSKTQFLSHLFRHLKLKVATLSPDQQRRLLTLLQTELKAKNIQLYDTDGSMQTVLEKYNWAGAMTMPPAATEYVYVVESNVGINKANRGISRQLHLTWSPPHLEVSLTLTNTNASTSSATAAIPTTQSSTHLHYINYQRVFISPQTTVKAITYQNKPITTWDESTVTTHAGETFKQIGFLVTLLEGQQGTITLRLETPPTSNTRQLFLAKQSGVVGIPVTLSTDRSQESFILESDTLLQYRHE